MWSLLCFLVTGVGLLVPVVFSGPTGVGSLSPASIDPPQWEDCSDSTNFLFNKQTALFFEERSFQYDLRLTK